VSSGAFLSCMQCQGRLKDRLGKCDLRDIGRSLTQAGKLLVYVGLIVARSRVALLNTGRGVSRARKTKIDIGILLVCHNGKLSSRVLSR
jgi:hypothetical protein